MANNEYYNVKRLALVYAVQAEIEAMKAENRYLKYQGKPIVNLKEDFINKAEELRSLAYCHDEQL
jgi:hypothetical protein